LCIEFATQPFRLDVVDERPLAVDLHDRDPLAVGGLQRGDACDIDLVEGDALGREDGARAVAQVATARAVENDTRYG